MALGVVPFQYKITTYQRDHLGEVVSVRAVQAIFILPIKKWPLSWEGIKDASHRRVAVCCDEAEDYSLGALNPSLVQQNLGRADPNQEGSYLPQRR